MLSVYAFGCDLNVVQTHHSDFATGLRMNLLDVDRGRLNHWILVLLKYFEAMYVSSAQVWPMRLSPIWGSK